MSINELIIYLTDKSGEYNKRKDWKWLYKNNIEVYNQLKILYKDISNDTRVSEIYYRLKHNIIEIPKCPVCGKSVKYTSNGYSTYCSKECWTSINGNKISREKHIETNLKKYGVKNTQNLPEVEKKRLKNREKSIEHFKQKYKQTCMERYGTPYALSSNIIREQIKQTNIKKYGVDHPMKVKEFWKKSQLKRTYSSKSKYELKILEILIDIFGKENVINQYSSDLYPYHCDFYIKPLDLYIELQGHWTHGPHPFNENDENDLKLLNTWIEKSNDNYYKHAIYTWTVRDIEKRNIAKQNNLNYLEIFGYNLKNTKKFIEDYLESFLI